MSGFVFVSGRSSLDFAGTMLWRRSMRTELLGDAGDLSRWFFEAGLFDLVDDPDTVDVEYARRVREAIYDVVVGCLGSGNDTSAGGMNFDPESAAVLNSAAATPLPTVTLNVDGMAKVTGTPRNGLSLLARDAIELLGSPDLAKMRECSNPDCTRLFVDVSRGGSRRWCGMAECGNRKKAADYRRRHKELST
ncbi:MULTISPECIES: CGNR zinc finger domain-containing protein [unclassified Gordonia (in: high G+C Gram-positive bacteria)]|uniref:CGNR zinc finger domain-containing protein n=1 Tax=unclassified Gordonia (in: high G+C Gram-positive bacteria) TaxID=2657482 RepID=UPI0009F17B3B|nr:MULTISPECIES: ABATE domain-containing protein [unclassified Gordonia (in: high G+C Gram-positive bacteria)]UCZ88035.1 CGNR zinc finger domain-containing protein [Gordonia sp. WA4-43]